MANQLLNNDFGYCKIVISLPCNSFDEAISEIIINFATAPSDTILYNPIDPIYTSIPVNTTANKKRKLTMKEHCHAAVRRAIFDNTLDINLPVDETYYNLQCNKVKSKSNWKKAVVPYIIRDGALYEYKVINSIIGVGIFAKQDVKKNSIFEGITGYCSGLLSAEESQSHPSSYLDSPKQRGIKRNQEYIQQPYSFIGPMALINHACDIHANCRPYKYHSREETYWKAVTAKKNIKVGEELTMNYEDGKLQCRDCSITINK